MSRSMIVTVVALTLATSALAPVDAGAVPVSAVAKAEARYEALLTGGTFVANVPSTDFEGIVISVGDVDGGALALPSLNCAVPGTFCIFGGNAAATAIANDGHIRAESGVGAFSVDFVVATPGVLIVNALIEDAFTLVGPIPPGGSGSASAVIEDFTLIGLPGEPIDFTVDPGDPATFALPVGTFRLVWSGLTTTAEAETTGTPVPVPATLALFGAALVPLLRARRGGVPRAG
ncbi:MAG: hypothetical protein JNK67_16975 [Alphaproteobacteria bacterium]|nr:hypothetical protein [Alphaproteobacteria bacterium]